MASADGGLPPAVGRTARHSWLRVTLLMTLLAATVGFVLLHDTPTLSTLFTSTPAATAPPVLPTPAALRARPLRLPAYTPGAPCPTSSVRTVNSAVLPLAGAGPVYLGFPGLASVNEQFARLAFDPHSEVAPGWGLGNVFWAAAPTYKGPVLVRSRQLGGSNVLRFGGAPQGSDGERFFQIIPYAYENNGWQFDPNYIYVHAAGCYALQIDGDTFTEVIAFPAVSV